jgi:hypothetical protein
MDFFFFLVGLEFELRAQQELYHLSHTPNPFFFFFAWVILEMVSHKQFA